MVIWAVLTIQILEYLFSQLYILLCFLESRDVLVDEPDVANCHSSIMVMVVTITCSEHLDCLVIVSNGYVIPIVPSLYSLRDL